MSKAEIQRNKSVIEVLKNDAQFEADVENLEKYGELKAYFFQNDFIEGLKNMGLQSYMINEAFEQTDLNEMAVQRLMAFMILNGIRKMVI